VNDLPETIKYGEDLAKNKSAGQLKSTADWQAAIEAELLVALGSLHYFTTPLPKMLAELASRPRCIMVNRRPLMGRSTFATVQNAGYMQVSCVVYNRLELIEVFQGLGYVLADEWQATESSLRVPNYPQHTIPPTPNFSWNAADFASGAWMHLSAESSAVLCFCESLIR